MAEESVKVHQIALEQRQQEIDQLKSRLASFEQERPPSPKYHPSDTKKLVQAHEETIRSLNSVLSDTQSRLDTVQASNERLRHDLDQTRCHLDRMSTERDTLKATCEQTKTELNEAQQSIHDLQSQLSLKNDEIQALTETITMMQSNFDDGREERYCKEKETAIQQLREDLQRRYHQALDKMTQAMKKQQPQQLSTRSIGTLADGDHDLKQQAREHSALLNFR